MAQPTQIIEVEVLTESSKAYKVDSDGDVVWLPKSQVTLIEQGDNMAKVTMPTWLYKEKFPDDPLD